MMARVDVAGRRTALVRCVLASQVALFSLLLACIALQPTYLLRRDEGGLSNFGVHVTTVAPYSLAFLLCALLLARAASLVEVVDPTTHRYRSLLVVLSCLVLLVLLSTYPYRLDLALRDVHIGVGAVLICVESAASIWIVRSIVRDRWSVVTLGVQLAGFVVATATFLGLLQVLFTAQLVTSLAFGVLLVRGAAHVGLDPPPARAR